MRIGCLQFAPVKGDVIQNISRADAVLLRAETKDLDLLILPEMAFTGKLSTPSISNHGANDKAGYNFGSLAEVFPYLEPSGSGTSSLWARSTALRHKCTVVCPYPENTSGAEPPEHYNSVIVINGDGETVGHYRKSHLNTTDEAWAAEGTQGFFHKDLPSIGSLTIGLSMDLNPYRFETAWHAFELAFHILEVQAHVLVVSMAWPTSDDSLVFRQAPHEPDMDTLMYWVSRLEPLIRCESGKETVVVFSNRTGSEDDIVYTGTSAVLGIRDGEVTVYGVLGRSEKELLVVDTSLSPYGRLICRPEGAGAKKEVSPGDESPSGSMPASFPYSLGKESAIESEARADSGAHEPEKAKSGGPPQSVLAVQDTVNALPQRTRRLQQPKLSLQTGPDVIKSSLTSSFDSGSAAATETRVMKPTEAIVARHHIDTKVHRPTPHPFVHRGPSPGQLFKREAARLGGEASSPYFSRQSANTYSVFGSEGALPWARNSFDECVLGIFTPARDHSGSDAASAKSRPSPLWTANPGSMAQETAESKTIPISRPISPKLRNTSSVSGPAAHNIRDSSRIGRSKSLVEGRRPTPSAAPVSRPRANSQNGLGDFYSGANRR